MTRLEAALYTGAALLFAAAIATAHHHMWWECGLFTGVSLFLLEGAYRERTARRARQRRARTIAARAARYARGGAIQPPRPCCQFWASSDGAVHGHDCTRPPAARNSLAEAEQQLLVRLDDDLKDSA